MDTLSKMEAYAAMYGFLKAIYERTRSDELGALLGGMSLLNDGGTADPGVWQDWEVAVRKVRDGEDDLGLKLCEEG